MTTVGIGAVGFAIGVACVPPTEPNQVPPDPSIEQVGSMPAAAVVGSTLSNPFTVRVIDLVNGSPIAGTAVVFSVDRGRLVDQSTAIQATTGADGRASVATWILPTTTGTGTITARIAGREGQQKSVQASISIHADVPAKASIIAGTDNQTSVAGLAVANAPAVAVADRFDNPKPGVVVTFTVTAGGGTLNGTAATSAAATTDSTGVARLQSWVLGRTAAANGLAAVVAGLESVALTFAAVGTPGPAAAILAEASVAAQKGRLLSLVALPPSVTVTDANGNPVAGVTVRFTVTIGGGLLLKNAADAGGGTRDTVTSAAGVATLHGWRLGPYTGTQAISVTLPDQPGVAARQLTAVPGSPAKVAAYAGNEQSAKVGAALGVPPAVRVTDADGAGVPGVFLKFAVLSGGGVLEKSVVETDTGGVARVTWTLGTGSGQQQLTATLVTDTVTGAAAPVAGNPVMFTATATAESATSASVAVGTSNQTATVGTNVPNPPAVTVADKYGNPVPGVPVTFTVTAGGGTLDGPTASSATTNTAANGVARLSSWTLGKTVGTNTVSAVVTGVETVGLTFTGVGTVGEPAQIIADPAIGTQNGKALSLVPLPPAVTIRDAHGNSVPNVAVRFAVATGGGAILWKADSARSSVDIVTDASGFAKVYGWRLGATSGTQRVAITIPAAPGVASVEYVANAAILAKVAVHAGDAQGGTVATPLPTAPAVKVTDASDAPVSGVPVRFVVTGGGGWIGQTVVLTNAAGVASAEWTMGTVATTQTLTATVVLDSNETTTFTGRTPGTLETPSVAGNPVVFRASALADVASQVVVVRAPAAVRNRFTMDTATVRIADRYGNTVRQAGVGVTVATDSAASILRGTLTATTSSEGMATFAQLSFAGVTGIRNLRFESAGLTTAQSMVTLHGGAPAQVIAHLGDRQSGPQLASVAVAPGVKVTDVDGNAVASATVKWSVTGGGGWVGVQDTVTGTDGVATPGNWTLGLPLGTNTLQATVTGIRKLVSSEPSGQVTFSGSTANGGTLTGSGISGNPVQFTATSTDRAACSAPTSISLGGTSSDAALRGPADCLRNVSGFFLPTDILEVTTSAAQTNFAVQMSAATMTPRLVADVWGGPFFYGGGSSPFTMYVFAAPGTHRIWATSDRISLDSTYGYTVAATIDPVLPTGCLYGIVTKSVSVTDALDATCTYTTNGGGTSSSRRYLIAASVAGTLTITMSSTAFDPYLELYTVSSTGRTFAALDDNGGGGNTARITLSATAGQVYEIRAGNAGGTSATGSFILTTNP